MNYEGTVWRVDIVRGGMHGSVIVLADTLEAAQEMARKALPDAQVTAFYSLMGVRGAIFNVVK